MISVFCVMLLLVGAINAFNIRHVIIRADAIVDMLSRGGGEFSDMQEPPDGEEMPGGPGDGEMPENNGFEFARIFDSNVISDSPELKI